MPNDLTHVTHLSQCPQCGHELSMFEEPAVGGPERVAMVIAERVASWWFVLGLAVTITVWVLINVAWHPFKPYPVIIFAVMSSFLGVLAALQGPLILLTQRRSTTRDRIRDREVLMVTANSEADLHRIEAKLDRLLHVRNESTDE